MAVDAMQDIGVSQRCSCKLLGLSRSSARYQSIKEPDTVFRDRIKEIATLKKRAGYRSIYVRMKREGMQINHKKVYRIYKEEGLLIRRQKRKRLVRERIPMPIPDKPNVRWSMDFISDTLANGRKFRVLTMMDEFTRESVALEPGFSMSGKYVAYILDRVCLFRGKPESIVVDNGPEFCSNALDQWAYENDVRLDFIQPGKPTQNAFIESFNGTFRDEFLNLHWFTDMDDVKELTEAWRIEYNTDRFHSSLGGLAPAEFKQQFQENLSKELVQL
jgi:putative transposase